MVHYSSFFVIGICLYRLYAGTARPITFITLAAALATTAFGGGEQAFWAPGYVYLPLTQAFTLLVWFATSRWSGWLILKPFVLLGRISYPLYLVHVALGFEVIRFGMERGWSTLQGVIAAGLISLIAATLLHYLVEAPGMRWSRSFINRKRVAAGTMPAKAPASAPEGIAASRRNAL
jgi:peptidoglycan/LPS O-acetylase OafA/YrhL